MVRNLFSFSILLFLTFGINSKGNSQAVLYYQDFENPASRFQGYVLTNFDKGIPANTQWASLSDSAWVVRYLSGSGTHAAIATSDYTPAVAANDWFITPAIQLGKASKLSWKGMSLNSAKPDSYEVFVSTSTQSASGCLINLPLKTITSEQSGSFNEYTFNLASEGYADQAVYIGFRLITQSGDLLAIDDIKVTDDSLQSLVNLTFKVNMSKYIVAGNFNPATDTVDVAGNFNGWDGTQSIMSIDPGSDSSIYSVTIPGFHDGDELQFKFRINSSWNDTAIEFPYGGPNRLWTVIHAMYTYSAYYNEQGTVSGLSETQVGMEAAVVYPNPFGDLLNIKMVGVIKQILMLSTQGRIVEKWIDPDTLMHIDTSRLPPGAYILQFYENHGFVLSRKLMKL